MLRAEAWLISGDDKTDKLVNGLLCLAKSVYPAGGKFNLVISLLHILMNVIMIDLAYIQDENLCIISYGPLVGKYIYAKTIYLSGLYLKKIAGLLGYSYVTSKSSVLLICDKLDMSSLIAPTGAYEQFLKSCETKCLGKQIIV